MNKSPLENPRAAPYLTRSHILALLSDAEVERVSMAETAKLLPAGEHYVDLSHPEQGVRIATGRDGVSGANVLLKRSVRDPTWRKIVAELAAPQAARPDSLQASPHVPPQAIGL